MNKGKEEFDLSVTKIYYKAIIIKSMLHWQRDRKINQQNRIKNQEIHGAKIHIFPVLDLTSIIPLIGMIPKG